MRSFRNSFLLFVLTPVTLLGQARPDLAPMSSKFGLAPQDVPLVHAAAFDPVAAAVDDARRAEAGELPLYGRMCQVGVGPHNSGLWNTLANGDRIWRVRIKSEGALATDLFFEDFHLPPGATFHVYDPDMKQIHGAFMDKDVASMGYFSTAMVFGEVSVVEYYEPLAVAGEGHFTVTQLSHAYRSIGAGAASDFCQVDVNCSEGMGWEAQRDAVVRIRVVFNQGTGWCTGALVNNTAQDCKPYILTALHCGQGSTTAHLQQFIFLFGFQRAGCASGLFQQGQQVTGCVKRADSNDNGGNSGSDFMLLELNNAITSNLNAYYAGWDASNSAVPNGRTIHHPSGDRKKISTFTSALQTASWGTGNGSHWRVVWSETENGYGVTEGGSSGSPIFDPAKRIVGTLTGGGSCCTVGGCESQFTGPNVPDYYGKMSYHFFGNPNSASQKLKEWLANGSSATVLDGSPDPCGNLVGMEENASEAGLEVYPNPSTDRFTVEYPEGVVRAEMIEVVDLSGRSVHAERPATTGRAVIDGSHWGAGTYLVRVMAGGVTYAAAKITVEGH